MKIKLLTCLFFILCSQAFSGSACETTFALKHASSEPLEPTGEGKQLQGLNSTIGLNKEGGGRRYEGGKMMQVNKIGGRGNGGYGASGGADVRPRNSQRSDASTFVARPSSVSLVQLSCGLLLVSVCFF